MTSHIDQTQRWLAITILDCLTELSLVALPIYLLIGLQMNLSNKVTCAVAFGFRLVVIPFSVLHYTTYTAAINVNATGTAISKVLSWQNATLCYSLLSATVPLSRTFFKRFETPNLVLNATGTYSRSNRIESTLRSDLSKTAGAGSSQSDGPRFWWTNHSANRNTYSTAVYHEEAARQERQGSRDMIIWREDAVEVQRS